MKKLLPVFYFSDTTTLRLAGLGFSVSTPPPVTSLICAGFRPISSSSFTIASARLALSISL